MLPRRLSLSLLPPRRLLLPCGGDVPQLRARGALQLLELPPRRRRALPGARELQFRLVPLRNHLRHAGPQLSLRRMNAPPRGLSSRLRVPCLLPMLLERVLRRVEPCHQHRSSLPPTVVEALPSRQAPLPRAVRLLHLFALLHHLAKRASQRGALTRGQAAVEVLGELPEA